MNKPAVCKLSLVSSVLPMLTCAKLWGQESEISADQKSQQAFTQLMMADRDRFSTLETCGSCGGSRNRHPHSNSRCSANKSPHSVDPAISAEPASGSTQIHIEHPNDLLARLFISAKISHACNPSIGQWWCKPGSDNQLFVDQESQCSQGSNRVEEGKGSNEFRCFLSFFGFC